MAKDEQTKQDNEFDIFIANYIYPEAEAIFTTSLEALEEIKDKAVIILDTNALLVPYNIGRESLEQIASTYRILVKEKRLVIPGQVAREFAKNRANKIAELFQQLSRKRNSIQNLQVGKYPLLESLKEYQDVLHLEEEIDTSLKEYRNSVDKVLDHIRRWTWNDPVSMLYSQVFGNGVVFDLAIDEQLIQEDLIKRHKHNIPPGYKDASKEDRGVGDLLIWHTILEIGNTRKNNVIFVSGDEKADWYHKSERQALYPRYELVDEFRRKSEGKAFHIVSFSNFLDLFGASKSVVQEVRQTEILDHDVGRMPALGSKKIAWLLLDAVYRWLATKNPDNVIERERKIPLAGLGPIIFDFIMSSKDQATTAVEVKIVTPMGIKNLYNRINQTILAAKQAMDEGVLDHLMFVIVADDENRVIDLAGRLEKTIRHFPNITFVFGVVNSDGDFEELLESQDLFAR